MYITCGGKFCARDLSQEQKEFPDGVLETDKGYTFLPPPKKKTQAQRCKTDLLVEPLKQNPVLPVEAVSVWKSFRNVNVMLMYIFNHVYFVHHEYTLSG